MGKSAQRSNGFVSTNENRITQNVILNHPLRVFTFWEKQVVRYESEVDLVAEDFVYVLLVLRPVALQEDVVGRLHSPTCER